MTLVPLGIRDVHPKSQEHPPLSGKVPDKRKQSDILELDKGINPNPFPNDKYGQGHNIRTTWCSYLKIKCISSLSSSLLLGIAYFNSAKTPARLKT